MPLVSNNLIPLPPVPFDQLPRDVQLSLTDAKPPIQVSDAVDINYALNKYSGRSNSQSFPTTASSLDAESLETLSNQDRNLSENHYNPNSSGDYESTKRLLVYPYDLGTSPENQNYILFDIYQSKGSGIRTVAEQARGDVERLQQQVEETGSSDPSVESTLLNAAGAWAGANALGGGGALGAIGGAGLFGGFTWYSPITSSIAGFSRGSQLAADSRSYFELGQGEIGFNQQVSQFSQPMEKVLTSIALHTPPTVETKYGAKYEDKDFTMLSHASAVGGGLLDYVESWLGGEQSASSVAALDAGAKVIGQQSLKMIDRFVMPIIQGDNGAGFGDMVSASLRAVPNPLVLQLFQSINRREFTFSYKFVPVNQTEADNIYDIVRAFKKYSHPRRVTALAGRYLEYPAEFRIRFMDGMEENLYLPRIARCVLTSVDVKYGSEGVYTAFENGGNARKGSPPIETNLQLTFSEVEILDQHRIDQGY